MTVRAALPMLGLTLLLQGCGGVSVSDLWPFDGSKGQELSRVPANSTLYQCDGNKRFYVRYMDNGAYAWIILPEREFRLDKVASAPAARYSNSKATLEDKGGVLALSDGPTVSYTGCKVPAPAPAPAPTPTPAPKPAPAASDKVSK